MGCDIHMVLEVKDAERPGHWVGIDAFKGHESRLDKGWCSPAATSRNYERFSALAGVRGEGQKARGLPADISETAAYLVRDWGVDGHSHSWLPLVEAAEIFLATEWPSRPEPNSYASKAPCSYYFGAEGELENYRLVFWFDN